MTHGEYYTMREIEQQQRIVTEKEQQVRRAESAFDCFWEWLDKCVTMADFNEFKDGYMMLMQMYKSRVQQAEREYEEAKKELSYMTSLNDGACDPDPAFGSWIDYGKMFLQ